MIDYLVELKLNRKLDILERDIILKRIKDLLKNVIGVDVAVELTEGNNLVD